MKVFGVQIDSVWENKEATIERAEALLARVSIPAGSLVVLPEMFACGFTMNVRAASETSDGPSHRFLRGLARRLSSTVVGGLVSPSQKGRGRNEAVVYDPNGEEQCRFQKLHPFSFAGEDHFYDAGSDVALFAAGGLQASPFICYDLRFPESFRAALRRGAELLIVIANWPSERASHWTTLLQARAIENQSYVVGVNRCGSDPNHRYPGASLVVGPRGDVLARGGDGEEVVQAELSPSEVVEYRESFPTIGDMKMP